VVNSGFEVINLGMRYGEAQVLSEVNLRFEFSQLTTLAGPNGAGKSTLLGILSRLRRDFSGECNYRGRSLAKWRHDAFAREVAYVPQSLRSEFPFSAEQVVLMGRSPHVSGMFESKQDREAAAKAMALTDTTHLSGRDFRTLSGGEKQRTILAAALAQDPKVLLLDEPTSSLDLSHQVALYRILQDLCAAGMLVVSVTHDLNLAGMYADRLVLLRAGRVAADGTPATVMQPDTIAHVFDVRSQLHRLENDRPWITYGY
jgi:iron complex transport system ATP-binding protein